MTAGVTRNTSFTPFHSVEGAGNDSLLKRMWNAVVDFFTYLAKKIKAGATAVWTTLKSCLVGPKTPSAPVRITVVREYASSWQPNLPRPTYRNWSSLMRARPPIAILNEPNRNMPKDNNALFLQKAVANLKAELQRKGGKHLTDFEESFSGFLAFHQVMTAAIREYLFNNEANDQSAYGSLFNFSLNKLSSLRKDFLKLPPVEQEIIIHAVGSDLSTLNLSEAGKEVIRTIGELANELIKHNLSFHNAYQAIITAESAAPAH